MLEVGVRPVLLLACGCLDSVSPAGTAGTRTVRWAGCLPSRGGWTGWEGCGPGRRGRPRRWWRRLRRPGVRRAGERQFPCEEHLGRVIKLVVGADDGSGCWAGIPGDRCGFGFAAGVQVSGPFVGTCP